MASDSNTPDKMNTTFDYSLRISPRAKYAKLQIKPFGGLEVVIPKRFPKSAIPDLIRQHAGWIQRQLAKYREQALEPELPHVIDLAISQRQITIDYLPEPVLNLCSENHLCIGGANYQHGVNQLRRWIRKEAWKLLPPLLEQLSLATRLGYKRVSIRSQKTRWGSCSASGTISLNDQLLFLPRQTVEYLIIHELCHTRHMNHSAKFWQLVEHHCAAFRSHEKCLNQAKEVIPVWFLRDLHS